MSEQGEKRGTSSAELDDKENLKKQDVDKEDEGLEEDEEGLEDEELLDEEDEDSDSDESNGDEPPKEYGSRSFVVSKTDFKSDEEEYPIWKIDGNSLLQKYIPFKDDSGQVLYRSTSVYSGWNISQKENYYPAPTIIKKKENNDTIVEFQKSLVKV